MRVVADASAVLDCLLGGGDGAAVERLLRDRATDALAPAHLDAEVLSAVARLVRSGDLPEPDVPALLLQLQRLPIDRLPIDGPLLSAAWSLRSNVAMRDALYVGAALGFGCRVLTTDERLARAVPDLVVDLAA